MKTESHDHDIRTLLSSGYYRIPRFQRPYSWDRDNIQEFWNDVVKDSPTEYFIGSMVVYKDGQQRFGVVDGQQRLNTITILLCALRNAFVKHGHQDLAEGIQSLVERRNIDNKFEFIVSTESSFPFFQEQIQKFGTPDVGARELKEEQSLKAAFMQLTDLVERSLDFLDTQQELFAEPEQRINPKDKLLAIRDALLNLKLIFIKLDDEDDAYVIFETLNTRGKDLSLKDLVKNHIVRHLKVKGAAPDAAKIK